MRFYYKNQSVGKNFALEQVMQLFDHFSFANGQTAEMVKQQVQNGQKLARCAITHPRWSDAPSIPYVPWPS
jgi:hypothetical protein